MEGRCERSGPSLQCGGGGDVRLRGALTCGLLSWSGVAVAQETACAPADPVVEAARTRWEIGSAGSLVLRADVPDGFTWTVEAKARFGPLRTGWSEGPYAADDGLLEVDVRPPESVFLDDLAEDYVTDLSIRLLGESGDGRYIQLLAPAAFVAWPSGRGGAAVVWDRPTMENEAPLGVVDPIVREGHLADVAEPLVLAVTTDGPLRVRPPLTTSRKLAYEPAPEGD